MEIKNGHIDGVPKSIEIEWTNVDETTTNINLEWVDLDGRFIAELIRFLIRRAQGET